MKRASLSAALCLHWLLPLSLFWLLPLSASAQRQATVVMTADRAAVRVGETFEVQVQVDLTGGDADNIELPDLSEFEVMRRSMQQPMSMRFGFGQQQPVVRMTKIWRYSLRAIHSGSFVISSTVVRLGTRRVHGNSLRIQVNGAGSAAPNPHAIPSTGQGTQEDVKPDPWAADQSVPATGLNGAEYDSTAFLQTTVDRADPYVGQQITVTVYLYTQAPLSSAPAITAQPTATGFWTRDLLPHNRNLQAHVQRVSGVPFRVYMLLRFAAFPLHPGALTIGAPEVNVRAGSLFDVFRAPETLHRVGVPVVVNARELPDAVSHAGGVVGDYRIEANLDRHQVGTGDAITLTATIRGRGNLSDVHVVLPSIDGLRVLAPRIEDDVQVVHDALSGTRRMEWLIVPERPGNYTIPSLGFDQFSVNDESWRRVETQPLTLVAAGNAMANSGSESDATQTPNTPTASDEPLRFRPIHPHSELLRARAPVSAAAYFPFALAAPPLLFVFFGLGLALIRRSRERAKADPSRAALRDAKMRLRRAVSLLKAGDAKGVYDAASEAILAAASARMGEAARGLTLRQLQSKLLAAGADEDLARRIVNELESCDFARFSAAGVERDEMQQALERARALVNRLDRIGPPRGAS